MEGNKIQTVERIKMNRKIVAIVGRPNIGKSTLFNRMTKTKDAIVADHYGVTRDRNYGAVEWTGKSFTLIDTGGFVPETKEFFESMIRSQIEIAIDEADIIIFLVDSKTGISAIDNDIVKILNKTDKRIILAVNKIDEPKDEADVHEFYNLGIGEPIGISAMTGRNLGNFLDLITEDMTLDSESEEVTDTRLKIAVIGKPNVGKSSLVNKILDKEKMIVSNIPGTTRDSIDSVLKYQGEEIVLIDTAGLRKRKKVRESLEFYSLIRTLRAIERADVVILMIDVTDGLTKQDIDILIEAKRLHKGLILAVNKWDLLKNKETNTARDYEKYLRESLEWITYIEIKFISVLEKQRLFKILDLAKEIKARRSLRIPTAELNDYLQNIIRTHTPPSVNGKFINIKYMSQVASDPPVFSFFVNEPQLLKENYKRFLEKKIREKYNYSGVPIVFKFLKK
ncbi:MAG TPA: ribosome biogenesis GTPase Der [Clostridiales bacterium]|jgi:GTPase|nr:ribosome biogenesis GTPase Der [Clostridiales bacterium]HQP68978.1 ribosome biogenesis GTPase Der [Clostridiales bacterium]